MVRKQKGQALVEMALGLPLLLLLLLGIIEGARVAWAYITVQQAAREAARYAVTGRPFLDSDLNLTDPDQIKICQGIDSDPDPIEPGVQPWLCTPEDRLQAIEEVALDVGRSLNVSITCVKASTNPAFDKCETEAGAFSVKIVGQEAVVDTTAVTPTTIVERNFFPGTEGLNVQVITRYNLQMMTPIFDAIVGGESISLRGAALLQNEGLDASIGINPPPPISTLDPKLTGPPPTIIGQARISSISGYNGIEQTESNFVVGLSEHAGSSSYNIFLADSSTSYQICGNAPDYAVPTDVQGDAEVSCDLNAAIGGLIPPGLYDLYSTALGTTSPSIAVSEAVSDFQVEIIATTNPTLRFVSGNNRWAVNEETQIELIAHQVPDEPFTLALYRNNGTQIGSDIESEVKATDGPFDWIVPDVSGCSFPDDENTPCFLQTRKKSDNSIYAELEVYINQPKLVLVPNPKLANVDPLAQGQTVQVLLEDHTPGKVYDIFIQDGGLTNPFELGTTLETNAFGDTPYAVAWTIPASCGLITGWKDGFYDLVSVPENESNVIAKEEDVEFSTPTDPFLTLVGGNTWPAGSTINIKSHLHEPLDEHYLEFDTARVPTTNSSNTYNTSDCGYAVVDYKIPVTTTDGIYQIISYLDSTKVKQAEMDVEVLSVPIIEVLEGDIVLPDQEITIRLTQHVPNTGYRVLYTEKNLFELKTDDTGQAEFKYDLSNLPGSPGPDPKAPSNLGKYFELYSENVNNNERAATTDLALQGADLQVTKIEFPPESQIAVNTTIPMTITVQNVQTVPINSFFDVDLYFNPLPVNPSYYKGYNFPGDVKHWKNFVAAAGEPGDTFTITEEFFVGEYGLQTLHGFADTSNFILEGESANQVANPNNLDFGQFNVKCTAGVEVETFDSLPSGWDTKWYGNADKGNGPDISSGQLTLQSDGSSTWQKSDSGGGQLFYYKTSPVTTTAGFEVVVQVLDVQRVGSWSKAGIEIRNDVEDNRSPRVVLGVARESGGSNYVIQPGTRNGGNMNWASPGAGTIQDDTRFKFGDTVNGGPVWLRIEREAGTNEFKFYFKHSSDLPPTASTAAASWWGTAFANATVSNISDQLYVGLFNSSYSNGTVGASKLDNFSVFDPDACEAAQGTPKNNSFPPGLTLCSDPIQDQSFELSPSIWSVAFGENVTRSPGQANSGNFKLSAPSFEGFATDPWFYQQFVMTDWVISTTTSFELSLNKNVNSLVDGNQPEDQFYAIVTTNPSSIVAAKAARVTTPTVVATGEMPPGPYNPTRWDSVNVSLPIIDPSTIENYAEQTLYLYLYNDSNSTGACTGFCTTNFFFDDVALAPCTSQPLPDPVNTRLTGELTLTFSDSSVQKLPNVKIWAYAQDDQTIYETVSLQDGSFNFYNLPATTDGTQYIIFAQHHLFDEFDETQVETLATDTSIIMRANVHTNNSPQRVSLSLISLLSPTP